MDELKRTKYDTWEWNFGRSPKYNLRNKRRWDGGTLEPCVEVDQGIIRQIVFYGDFLAVSPMDEVTGALVGTPFRREDVAAVLDRFPLSGLFRHHHPGPGAGYNILCGLRQRPQKQKERRARRVSLFASVRPGFPAGTAPAAAGHPAPPGAGPRP